MLVVEVGGEWEFTVPLDFEQEQYMRALGLTEHSLLRKRKAKPTRNQKLPLQAFDSVLAHRSRKCT